MKKLLMVSILALSATSFAVSEPGSNPTKLDSAQQQYWKNIDKVEKKRNEKNHEFFQSLLDFANTCENFKNSNDYSLGITELLKYCELGKEQNAYVLKIHERMQAGLFSDIELDKFINGNK